MVHPRSSDVNATVTPCTVLGSLRIDGYSFVYASYLSIPTPSPGVMPMITVMVDGRTVTCPIVAGTWVNSASGQFIQALAVSNNALISMIEVSPLTTPMPELLRNYYENTQRFDRRLGPRSSDTARLTEVVEYERPEFAQAGVVVAPPVIVQSRGQKTTSCKASSSTRINEAIIGFLGDRGPDGAWCGPPYDCGPAEEDS